VTAHEQVALHYERKAVAASSKGRGAEAWFFRQWSGKVLDGKTNLLVRRVQRMMEAR